MSAHHRAAPQPSDLDRHLLEYVLRLGDTSLVLAQGLGAWIGHAPAIEEDLGLANTALDLLGQARMFLTYAGELEGLGRDEDQLASQRLEADYRNLTIAEAPNGDFGDTIVRQFLLDAYQNELYERLVSSADSRLADIASKAVKETRYHLRFSSSWLIRLGDGTTESHDRVQDSLTRIWKFTTELRTSDETELTLASASIAPDPQAVADAWSVRVDAVLSEATLTRPAEQPYRWFGKQGRHTEHLGHLLTDLQYLPRAIPGASW